MKAVILCFFMIHFLPLFNSILSAQSVITKESVVIDSTSLPFIKNAIPLSLYSISGGHGVINSVNSDSVFVKNKLIDQTIPAQLAIPFANYHLNSEKKAIVTKSYSREQTEFSIRETKAAVKLE